MASRRQSITLVGRASRLAFREFESGATLASFDLTINRAERPPLTVRCEGYGIRIREQFEQMDEGSLVGIIGTIRPILEQDEQTIVCIDRLEVLGKPLPVVEEEEEEEEPASWHDHPSLTAEERNSSLYR